MHAHQPPSYSTLSTSSSNSLLLPTQHVQVAPGVEIFYDIFKAGDPHDDTKPWLMFVPPFLCDTSLCHDILKDPQLLAIFNIITSDRRHHGRTKSPIDARADLWTCAADVLILLDALDMGPVHMLGGSAMVCEVSLRIALMAPERVLSICNWCIGGGAKARATHLAIRDVLYAMSDPDDPEEWDEAVASLMQFLLDKSVDVTFMDRLAAALIRRHPPTKVTPLANAFLEVFPEPGGNLQIAVPCPVLIVSGADALSFHTDAMYSRLDELAAHGPIERRLLPGASGLFIVGSPLWHNFKQVYLDWVVPLLPSMSATAQARFSSGKWKNKPSLPTALSRFAQHFNDPSKAQRDAWDANSYSTRDPEWVKEQTLELKGYAERGRNKFELLGGNAKESWENAPWDEEVPWKFSERFYHKTFGMGRGAGEKALSKEPVTVSIGFRSYDTETVTKFEELVRVVST